MISEESRDTKNWSNGSWKFSFAVTGINYIKKNKKKPDYETTFYFYFYLTV